MYASRNSTYDQSAQALCLKNYLEVCNKVPAVEACFAFEFTRNVLEYADFYEEYPEILEEFNRESDKWSYGILKYSGPRPSEPGDYVSERKEAFYMYKSYRRYGS